jgi:hypothetical protein
MCNETSVSLFDAHLVEHLATRNILLRMQAFRQRGEHIGAGLYLGSRKYDETLGDLLNHIAGKGYREASIPVNDHMRALCKAWGEIQAQARSMIIEETWKALHCRQNWPLPEGFLENMSSLLEHNVATSLRGSDDERLISELNPIRFWGWFSQVETLREIKADESLLSLLARVRDFKRSGISEIPQPLTTQLIREGHGPWLDVLKDPSASNVKRFCDSVWGKAPEVSPLEITLKNGCIHALRISDQQALEYWSKYLAYPSVQQIKIVSPTTNQALPWYGRGLRGQQPAFRTEMEELASLPLSSLITELLIDVSGASTEEVAQIFESRMHFLETLRAKSLWRSASHTQKIRLEFASPSYEVIQYFQDVAATPSLDGNLQLSNAKLHRSSEGEAIELIATILPHVD